MGRLLEGGRRRRRRSSMLGVLLIVMAVLYAPRLLPSAEAPAAAEAGEAAAYGGIETEGEAGEISRILLSLVVILLAAKLGGELVERIGQPAVLGELAFGVLIGNLDLLGVTTFHYLETDVVLEILAEIGVILLLFEVGLESKVHEMMAVGLSSFLVACLGVIAPFFLGWGAAWWFWEDLEAMAPAEMRESLAPFAVYVQVFIGAVLCATSVGITARVLKDMQRIQTREARVVLGAAVIDDVLGLIVLAVCVGMVSAIGGGEPLRLDRAAQQIAAAQGAPEPKTAEFSDHLDKVLKGRDETGYLYNTTTGQGAFVGERPSDAFRQFIERSGEMIRTDQKVDPVTIEELGQIERFEALGVRLYTSREPFSTWSIVLIIVKAVVFFVGMILVGPALLRPVIKAAARLRVRGVLLSLALVICFTFSYLAFMIGLAPIVGAFAAGLILEDVHFLPLPETRERTLESLIPTLTTFLTPIFFVRMGIMVNVDAFANVGILGFAGFLTLAAIVGKQICALGVLEKGADRLAVGLGMIPRGEVGLIFANEGTKLTFDGSPIIDPNVLSAVVIMVIVTTLVTPPLLKWRFQRVRPVVDLPPQA